MKQRTKERREALQVLDKLKEMAVFGSVGRHGGVGHYTKKLSELDREKLKRLKSEDVQESRF